MEHPSSVMRSFLLEGREEERKKNIKKNTAEVGKWNLQMALVPDRKVELRLD